MTQERRTPNRTRAHHAEQAGRPAGSGGPQVTDGADRPGPLPGPPEDAPADRDHDIRAALEEITEDSLEFLRRLASLEQAQAEVLARLNQIEQQSVSYSCAHADGLDQLRHELLADRRYLAGTGVLNAVSPWLEALRRLRSRADEDQGVDLPYQIDAVVDVVTAMLRDLGFGAFTVDIGEPFDPRRMTSAGYADGAPGIVLGVVAPGYQTGGTVVRPVQVLISPPEAVTPAHPYTGDSREA
jgi:molecular chaperone GrpE (heat shock protein)